MPPPDGAELPVIVLFATRSDEKNVDKPPPLVPAELPLMVLFTMLRSPPPTPPPVVPAELPLTVLFSMLTSPPEIPPPLVLAELPLMVLLATVRVGSSADPTPIDRGRIAANDAIGNRDVCTAAKNVRCSDNTAPRITAHRSAEDRRGHNSKFAGGVINTDEVVTDIAIHDRQAAQFSIPPTELPLMTQFMTVNVPPLSIPVRTVPYGQARDRRSFDRDNQTQSWNGDADNRELVGARA